MSSKFASSTQSQPLDVSAEAPKSASVAFSFRGRSLTAEALRRLRRDKMAVAGAILLLAAASVSLLAPLLAPHDPIETNLSQRLLSVGFVIVADDMCEWSVGAACACRDC